MNYRACPNLVRLFLDQAARLGDKPFIWGKRSNAWQSWSWKQAEAEMRRIAGGLAALGIKQGDRVALVAENRPEWVIADLAIMATGAIAVPAYVTNTVDDHRHILSNAGCAGAIVSTGELAERVIEAARQTPGCGFVVAIDPPKLAQDVGLRVLRLDELTGDYDVAATAGRLTRQDLACIIHTSGTGGLPKGVALRHGSLLHNCQGAHDLLIELGLLDDVFLSFLPMSHSYEHMAGVHFPISIGAQIYCAESVEALPVNMIEAQPTIMTAVPRLYETMHRRILAGVERQGGLKARLFFKALELGTKRYHDPKSLTLGERVIDLIVDRLVRDKVRGRFGGRLKALVSGGAALNPEIGVFFTALGLCLLQGYGQTESAPVIACNRPSRVRLETVGPPLTDVEVKTADDGELLVRGELVMQGYWNDPEATAATVKDGWLHTGDIGVIEPDGYIRITDRKKDFIKNSGGDMIAPARVEAALVMTPEIAQAMVYGDRKPHLVAVLVPHADFLNSWAKSNGKPAALAEISEDPGLRSALEAVVQRINAKLAQAERVRRFILAHEPFSVANELMTPTLKVKRHKVREIYGQQLDALYRDQAR